MSPERKEGGRDKDRRVRKYGRRSLDRPPDGVVVGGRDAAGPWRKESQSDRRAHPEPERPTDEGEYPREVFIGWVPNWNGVDIPTDDEQVCSLLRTGGDDPRDARAVIVINPRADEFTRLRASRPTEGGEDAVQRFWDMLTPDRELQAEAKLFGVMPAVRRCAECERPYVDWSVESRLNCTDCRRSPASSLGEREALEARLARAAHMLGAVLTRSAADDFDRDRVSESFDEVQAVRRALTSQEAEG